MILYTKLLLWQMIKHRTNSAQVPFALETPLCKYLFVLLTALFSTLFSLLTLQALFIRVILFLHFYLCQSFLVCQLSSHWHLFWGGAAITPPLTITEHHTAPFEREIKSFKEGRNEAGGKTIQKLNLTTRWMHYSVFFLALFCWQEWMP